MRRFWKVGLLALLLMPILLWQRAQHDHCPAGLVHPLQEPETAQRQLREIFDGSGPEAHQLVDRMMTALRRSEYEAAVEDLLALRRYTGKSFEAWQKFNGVYVGLQQDVARRADAGDAAALQAAELFKNLPCCLR